MYVDISKIFFLLFYCLQNLTLLSATVKIKSNAINDRKQWNNGNDRTKLDVTFSTGREFAFKSERCV